MSEEEKTNDWPWVHWSSRLLEAEGEASQNSTIFAFLEHAQCVHLPVDVSQSVS